MKLLLIAVLVLSATPALPQCLALGDNVVDPDGERGVISAAFCDQVYERYEVTYADGEVRVFESDMVESPAPLPAIAKS